MTLRELLKTTDMEEVISYINKKDSGYIVESDRPSLEETDISYSSVIVELLALPVKKPYKYSIVVKLELDLLDNNLYPSVLFLNNKYVKPEAGLLPYFTSTGKRTPKGHYNANADKHIDYYAFGFVDWAKIIDTPVIIDESAKELSLYAVLGEILWELTYNGWTRKDSNLNNKKLILRLKSSLKSAVEDIDSGKAVYLSLEEFLNKIKL